MAGQLTDDGTMDTVISCPECGEEMRFNYAAETDSGETYDDFVSWAIGQFDEYHVCPDTEDGN